MSDAKNQILEMTADEYHARPEISNSGLGHVLISPSHYIAWKNQTEEAFSPAKQFGSATHLAVLEPEQFYKRVIGKPDGHDGRTTKGKEWTKENEHKIILSAVDFRNAEGIAEAAYAHPTVSSLIKNGKPEQSLFWTDPTTGVRCRLRTDYLRDGIGIDLKTTLDASPNEFRRSIVNFGYHRQAAFYLDGIRACTDKPNAGFTFIAIEKAPPFGIGVFVLDQASVDIGRDEYQKGLALFKKCLAEDKWPGYPTQVQTISLPDWKFKEVLNG